MNRPVAELEKEVERGPATPTARVGSPAERWANPRFRRLIFGAATLLLLVVVGFYLYFRGRETTDDAQVDGHIVPVASKVYGNVAEVLVDDNQAVKAGQVLVRLDARDYQANVSKARAALALAEAQASSATVGVPWTRETTQSGDANARALLASAEADAARARLAYEQASSSQLAYARANVEKSEASYERARADLERMRPLMAKAEISRLQFDAYQSAARVAESEWKAARERLAQAEQDVEISRAARSAAEARVQQARAGVAQARANFKQVNIRTTDASAAAAAVAQARANLEAAELQLSYATIAAPVDGVVTRKSVETGQIVQPGQGLLVLVPLADIWVTANFKETQLARVRPGQKAEIKVDMYGKKLTGRVDSIAGATGARLSLLPPENATGNFVKVVQRIPVKIVLERVPPEKTVLRPGMNVEVTIFSR